jgi:hypothetical protein
MISSMTAFARATRSGPHGDFTWELRSVNHRYLELSLRLPDALRGLEPRVRELASRELGRGKVDITLRHAPPVGASRLDIDEAALAALLAAAAQATVIDDFRDAGKSWTPLDPKTPGTATVANGVLSLSSPVPLLVLHGIALPTATRYRAEVDITFRAVDPAAKASGAGLALRGALGDQLQVQLTSNGLVRADYTDGKTWGPLPIQYTRAGKARATLNATDRLAVERHDGYFRVHVNGEYVARTRTLDLTPVKVGLMHQSDGAMTVEYDNVVAEAYGPDQRFRRLLNIQVTPGSHFQLFDDFERKDKKATYPTWGLKDNESIAARIENGEMIVQGKKEDSDDWIVAEIEASPGGLANQLGVVVRQVGGDAANAKGISALGRKKEGDKATPEISLQVGQTSFRLLHIAGDGTQSSLVPWTASAAVMPTCNLTLVVENGRLLVFLNGEYQTAVDAPKDFELARIGLALGGAQTVAFDKVYARDF